jgi:hypothetical protein
VATLELIDLHLHGRYYTWSNERDSPTLVKLDRALVTVDWEEAFPNFFLQALSSDASDHCPLLLYTNASYSPKLRFHFECYWPKIEGYADALSRGWHCPPHMTDPFTHLNQLYRNLIRELQSWSAKRIGNIREQLFSAREVIFKLDQAQDYRALSAVETELRRQLKFISGADDCKAKIQNTVSQGR